MEEEGAPVALEIPSVAPEAKAEEKAEEGGVSAPASAATTAEEELRYELLESVGEGASGVVYRARDSATGGIVAVKVINLEDTTEDLDDIHTELQTLLGVHNRFLVRYLDSYVRGSELHIVMEYMDGGSLAGLLKALPGGGLDEATVAWVLRDLCEALGYLHAQRLLHRDVKASNVLVNSNGDVKLADFGASAQLTETVTKRQTLTGTPFWMAPEVIQQSDYDAKADIWSLGITAIELATGEPPLASENPMKVLFLIPKRPPPTLGDAHSRDLRAFVGACCRMAPDERPSAAELLRSDVLESARRTDLLRHLVRDQLGPRQGHAARFYKPAARLMPSSPDSSENDWVFSPGVSPGVSPVQRGRRSCTPSRGLSRSPTQSPPSSSGGASPLVGSFLDETTIRAGGSRRFPAMQPEPAMLSQAAAGRPNWERTLARQGVPWLTQVYMPCVEAVEAAAPDYPQQREQLEDAAKMLELAGILMDGAAADGRVLRSFLRRMAERLDVVGADAAP